MTKARDISRYGLGVGIQSAGSVVTGVGITQLNFIGTGNTFRVSGGTVDISISGGGDSLRATVVSSTWSQVGAGLTFTTGIGTNLTVSGVSTLGNVVVGGATTQLVVTGDARVTGILTIGTGSITLNGTSNIINVGTGLTLSSSGVNVTGVITATSFVGNGSGLTGAGSTVSDDTSTNATFYPVLTQTTSGTITASKVSTTKLTFNPSTGTVTATTFSGQLTGNSSTATSAATLTTARNINSTSFNGSANIEVNPSTGAYSNGYGARTIQSGGTASGGSNGDIFYIY